MASNISYAPPATYAPCSSLEGPESLSLAPGDELWLVQLPPRMNVGVGSSWTVTMDADGKLLAETGGDGGEDALRLEAESVGGKAGDKALISAPVPLVVPQHPGASAVKISRVATIFRASNAQRLCFGDADVVADPGGEAARILAGGKPKSKASRAVVVEKAARAARERVVMKDDEDEDDEDDEDEHAGAHAKAAEPLADEEGKEDDEDQDEDEEEAKEAEAFKAELQAQEKGHKSSSKHGSKDSKKHSKEKDQKREKSEDKKKRKKEKDEDSNKTKSDKKRSHKDENKDEKKKKKSKH